MAGISILDAFKALDEISDDVVEKDVKKLSKGKKQIKESLKEEKIEKIETIDISGKDMFDRGQAYYYARTGDHIDYDGVKYELVLDKDGGHKIGYSDTLLLKNLETGEVKEVSKQDFIKNAQLLEESCKQEDYSQSGIVKIWIYKTKNGGYGWQSNHFKDSFEQEFKSKEEAKANAIKVGKLNGYEDRDFDVIEESCELKEEPVYDMKPEFDSRKSFYGKAEVDERPDGTKILYSYGTPVCRIKDGKVTLLRKGYLGWASSQTTLRHVKEFLKQNGFKAGSVHELSKMYPIEQAGYNEELHEAMKVNILDSDEVEEGKEFLKNNEKSEEAVEKIVDVDANTIEELKDSYIGNVILRCPSCKTLMYKKPELLEKEEGSDIYNVGEACSHCGSKDGFELVGQVASMEVETDEVPPTTGKDDVADTFTAKEEPVEEPEEEKTEIRKTSVIAEESLNLNEFSEDEFNTLVNKYLQETYSNVESYTTTSGKIEDNKIVIEGVVKFKSGKEKSTTFTLSEGKKLKNGKYRFTGLNETFSKNKRAFSLVGNKVDDNLVCESLSYNCGKFNDKVVKGKVRIK